MMQPEDADKAEGAGAMSFAGTAESLKLAMEFMETSAKLEKEMNYSKAVLDRQECTKLLLNATKDILDSIQSLRDRAEGCLDNDLDLAIIKVAEGLLHRTGNIVKSRDQPDNSVDAPDVIPEVHSVPVRESAKLVNVEAEAEQKSLSTRESITSVKASTSSSKDEIAKKVAVSSDKKKITEKAEASSSEEKITEEAEAASSEEKITEKAEASSSEEKITEEAEAAPSEEKITEKAETSSSEKKITEKPAPSSSEGKIIEKAEASFSKGKITEKDEAASSEGKIAKKGDAASSDGKITIKAEAASCEGKIAKKVEAASSERKITKKPAASSTRDKSTTEKASSSKKKIPSVNTETVKVKPKNQSVNSDHQKSFPFADAPRGKIGFWLLSTAPEKTKDDIVGYKEVKSFLEEMALKQRMRNKVPFWRDHTLLFGDPGVGKSLIAEVIATTVGARMFVRVTKSNIFESDCGPAWKIMQELFEWAFLMSKDACICICFENAEKIFPSSYNEDRSIVYQIRRIVEFGRRVPENLVLIATTCWPQEMDAKVMDIFGRHNAIFVDRPDAATKRELLKHYYGLPFPNEIDDDFFQGRLKNLVSCADVRRFALMLPTIQVFYAMTAGKFHKVLCENDENPVKQIYMPCPDEEFCKASNCYVMRSTDLTDETLIWYKPVDKFDISTLYDCLEALKQSLEEGSSILKENDFKFAMIFMDVYRQGYIDEMRRNQKAIKDKKKRKRTFAGEMMRRASWSLRAFF